MIAEKAKEYAINKHNEVGCEYDGQSYEVHLQNVVNVGLEYLHYIPEDRRDRVIAALWLHDVIEDCRVTYNDLKNEFDEFTTDIVYAVTNELGKNRKERAKKTYPKIIENPYAIFVKMCDRKGNTKHSKDTGHRMYNAYQKEYPNFRNALKQGNMYRDLWDDLDAINGYNGA